MLTKNLLLFITLKNRIFVLFVKKIRRYLKNSDKFFFILVVRPFFFRENKFYF